ncbi:MAG: RNB domain-containing ribonuclease, partial [Candidatus Eisenbacteria bacterium]|nr:RNB domain-containing ribonuclease [Candidatus Eisenbacteria bacterium]
GTRRQRQMCIRDRIESGAGPSEVVSTVRLMDELAAKLRAARFARGGFDLEIPETEVDLDASGMPVRLRRHETLPSHRLIEEFMILANRMVGRQLAQSGLPLLFRVHGEPDADALERFAELVLTLLPGTRASDVATLPALRRFLVGLPRGGLTPILHAFFLRSMKQAVYSAVDLGHFGLGIDRYCHFTSPIRRYPDLFNHRVVRWLIRHPEADADEPAGATGRRWQEAATVHAIHSSKTERTAEKAEREIVRLKVLRWAESRIGEVHAGRVTGLTPSGLFVEFEDVPVEGFIARATLPPAAHYVEERFAFVEKRSKWELRLGDRVEAQIVRVDLRDRFLDLEPVSYTHLR